VAAPSGQLPIGRYLGSLFGLLVLLYLLVFFTGNSATPRLGLDLQGGTTVTLAARTENRQDPSPEALDQARQIIERRVNGLGVAEAEVVTQGNDRIVISVPGQDGDAAKEVGQTAQLSFRPVKLGPFPATPAAAGTATPSGSAAPSGSATPAPSASAGPPAGGTASPSPAGFAGRPLAKAPAPSATTPAPTASGATPSPAAPTATTTISPQEAAALFPGASPEEAQLLAKLDCTKQQSVLERPDQPIAACGQDGTEKYLLQPSIIPGTEVASATALGPDQNNPQWRVGVDFKSSGQATWARYTSQHNVTVTPNDPANRVAFTLDGRVISAPEIQGTINGQTEVTGSFDQASATDLANVLKYGALPLTFEQQEALTVSPTLGTDQLKAGMLAGGIGIALVFLYSLLYYRALGIVMIASLLLSGVLIYAVLVILGRQIGFTLTLAGVAGFIVSIGITADSFVVFFERLKDEIREGRSPRSAVPRAWVRARRTVLSADAVSFLAAAILYYLAAGSVKGFAFTLGMSTVLDLVIVFLFTHPIVALAARSKTFMSPRWSGLGAVQKVAAKRAAEAAAAGPAPTRPTGRRTRVPAKAKES
jgi:preprotein translocase subunit SecD